MLLSYVLRAAESDGLERTGLGLRMHWQGASVSLKRSLLPHDPVCDCDGALVASLEALERMEPSQLEYVRRRRCDSAGEPFLGSMSLNGYLLMCNTLVWSG